MPNIHLRLHRDGDPTMFPGAAPIAHDQNGNWTAVLIEGGMFSGHPSVALMIETDQGLVIAETSLLAFQAAGRGLVAMAESQLGWRMPS